MKKHSHGSSRDLAGLSSLGTDQMRQHERRLREVQAELGITVDADGNRHQNRSARRAMEKALRTLHARSLIPG